MTCPEPTRDKSTHLHIAPGALRIEWCDQCLHSHAKADIFADSGDPTTAFRIGTWNEGHEEQEDQ